MIPVILCGGSGSRLWPLSSKKPFYKFFENQSLLEMSLKRLKCYDPFLIISVKHLKSELEKTLKEKSYKTEIIYEPEPKNTAVSVALACHLLNIRQQGGDIIGIFPSDHFIGKEQGFQKLVSTGVQIAKEEQKVVTFGILPDTPCSAYGYIKFKDMDRELNGISVKQAVGFAEKPNLSKSSSFIKEGYLWNSGMFLSPVNVLIQYFKNYLPDLWKQICCLKEDLDSIHSIYHSIKPVSFDKGIMENVSEYICLPCDIGWSDLGSWNRIADWEQKNPEKLSSKANVVLKDSKGNFVFSSTDKSIGLIGVKDLLVVNGEEGVLVANKGAGESVKYVKEKFSVKTFQKILAKSSLNKKWITKPWGAYRVIMEEDFFKYKEIKVEPGHQLSCQSHKKRSEHWIVISGLAQVTINGSQYQLKPNEHIFIEQGAKHRLKNPTETTLVLLEIQRGVYLGEDDIIRYEDEYGRD